MEIKNDVIADGNVMKEFIESAAYKILLNRWNAARKKANEQVYDLSIDKSIFSFETRINNVNMIDAWIDIPNKIIALAEAEIENKKTNDLINQNRMDKECLQRA